LCGLDTISEVNKKTTAVFEDTRWTDSRMQKLIFRREARAKTGEKWSFGGIDRSLVLYEGRATRSAPIGVLAYSFGAYCNSVHTIGEFGITLALAWITPAMRRRGYGHHLIAHLINYLANNPLRNNAWRIQRKGVTISIHADAYSDGGEALGYCLSGYFDCCADGCAENVPMGRRAWPVRSVVKDVVW